MPCRPGRLPGTGRRRRGAGLPGRQEHAGCRAAGQAPNSLGFVRSRPRLRNPTWTGKTVVTKQGKVERERERERERGGGEGGREGLVQKMAYAYVKFFKKVSSKFFFWIFFAKVCESKMFRIIVSFVVPHYVLATDVQNKVILGYADREILGRSILVFCSTLSSEHLTAAISEASRFRTKSSNFVLCNKQGEPCLVHAFTSPYVARGELVGCLIEF